MQLKKSSRRCGQRAERKGFWRTLSGVVKNRLKTMTAISDAPQTISDNQATSAWRTHNVQGIERENTRYKNSEIVKPRHAGFDKDLDSHLSKI